MTRLHESVRGGRSVGPTVALDPITVRRAYSTHLVYHKHLMAHLHILLCCFLIGCASVDLCFDSLILFNSFSSESDALQAIGQVQNYYQRTRVTFIVPIIQLSIIGISISLFHCLLYRRYWKDIIALFLFLCLVPYYIFVMEPAEDSCIGNDNPHNLSNTEIRDGLYKVGIGHVIIVIAASVIVLCDLEWQIPSSAPTEKKRT